MEASRYAELFLAESREHISALNDLLLALEAGPAGSAPLEGVFRAVHTIKGMSATMGYGSVAELAHEMETLLELVRHGGGVADRCTLDLLFASTDALERAVQLAVGGREGELDLAPFVVRLRAAATAADAAKAAGIFPDRCPAERSVEGGADSATGAYTLQVNLIVGRGTVLAGVRAFLALRRAREMGVVSAVEPPEQALADEGFSGDLAFVLRTELDPAAVHEALWAVGDLERVLVQHQRDGAAAELTDARAPVPPLADDLGQQASTARHIRVDLRRLDALVNGVGELAIVRDRLQQLAANAPELEETVGQASRLITELQDEIMRVRMVPVWQVFDRFPRLVRDAAGALGKQVTFIVEGKEIELDRAMLDGLGEALVHLLRNAVGHGIEPPEKRRLAGKPETGVVRLRASRERSQAVIRVEDDGRGIDRARVIRAAMAAGQLGRNGAARLDDLDDDEVLQMITRPGFSTAERVTGVSGRGVGMDAVATRVRSLGGVLEIASEEGTGSCFTLRLPLTLAVLRVLLVGIGRDRYAIPVMHISETLELAPGEIRTIAGTNVIRLRGETIPVLDLRSTLRYPDPAPPCDFVPVVVFETGDELIGLRVDSFVGQQEIVVKTFDTTPDTLRCFSGATILSDGRPALILDAGSLISHAAPPSPRCSEPEPSFSTSTRSGIA